MTSTAKDQARLDSLFTAAAGAILVDRPNALKAISDAERVMKRVVRRAETPDGYERVSFAQRRGPTIEATARLLRQNSYQIERGQPLEITLEIWETVAGALMAVSASTLADGTGREDIRVTVVPPTEDVLAMRLAVMDGFDWHDYAKTMARKLGWSLVQELD